MKRGGVFSFLKTLAILAVVGTIVAAGWVVWQRMSGDNDIVDSYKACVDAGNPVQESYPEVCMTEDGKRFTNPAAQVFQPPSEGQVP